MKVSMKKVKVIRLNEFAVEKNVCFFLHQSGDNSEIPRLANKCDSTLISQLLFFVKGRVISSKNVPHKNSMLTEKELFKLAFAWSIQAKH